MEDGEAELRLQRSPENVQPAQGAAPVQMLLLEKFYTFEKWEDLIGMFCSAFGWTLPEKCMISAHILRQINEADK